MTGDYFSSTLVGQMLFSFLLTLVTQNMVFSRALGTTTVLWVIRRRLDFVAFGIILTIITLLSSIAAYFTLPYLLESPYSFYIAPLTYVLIISIIYILMLLITNRLPLKHKRTIRMFVHRCAFNSTVLGTLLLLGSEFKTLTLPSFIGFSIGSGVGFLLAVYMISIAYDRLNSDDIPASFRGFPITLFYLGILSLAIYGMIGHELPI